MGLTVLPPGRQEAASEWSGAAIALREVCEEVGLSSGATPGSLVARLALIEAKRTQSPRAPATIACLGDSITAQNTSYDDDVGTAKPIARFKGEGYMTWANIFLGQRFQFSRDLNFGVSGDTTAQMLARVDDVIASGADVCVVHGGTNDDYSLTANIETTKSNLTSIYEALRAVGMLVVAIPILPRESLAEQGRSSRYNVNNWIRRYCRETPGMLLADPTYALTDQTDAASGDPISGAMSDGLHPDILGAMKIGRAVAAALDPITAPCVVMPSHGLDAYHADYNPEGTLVPNGTMVGTAGSAVSPATGQVATSWTLERTTGTHSSGTAVASKLARDDGNGEWQVITLSGLSGGGRVRYELRTTIPYTSFAQNDLLDCELEVDVSGAEYLNVVGIVVREWDGSAQQSIVECPSMTAQTSYGEAAWSGVIRTPRMIIENAVTASSRVYVYVVIDIDAGAAGDAAAVVKIGRVAIRKVIS